MGGKDDRRHIDATILCVLGKVQSKGHPRGDGR